MVQYLIARLILMIKIFACYTHCLDFTGIKSLKCTDQHIAFSGFHHGATKTCMSMFLYKTLSCNGKKIFKCDGATHTTYWRVSFQKTFFNIVLSFRYYRLFIQHHKLSKKRINVTKVFLELQPTYQLNSV